MGDQDDVRMVTMYCEDILILINHRKEASHKLLNKFSCSSYRMLTLLLTLLNLVDGKRFLVRIKDNGSYHAFINGSNTNRGIVCPTSPILGS